MNRGYSQSLTATIQASTTEERVGEQISYWIDEDEVYNSVGDVTYEWSFGPDATWSKLGKKYYVIYATKGSKTVEVVIKDRDKDDNDIIIDLISVNKQINIIDAFKADFEASVTQTEVGEVVELAITSVPQDNIVGNLSFAWDFGEGADPAFGFYDQGETIQVTYSNTGEKTVSVEVTDNQNSGTTSKNITIGGSNCFNGVLDAGELKVDCGGNCGDCEVLCLNDVQDGDETSIDYGGRCGTGIKLSLFSSADEVALGKPINFIPVINNRGIIFLSYPIEYTWDLAGGKTANGETVTTQTVTSDDGIGGTISDPSSQIENIIYSTLGDKVISVTVSVNGQAFTATKTISVVTAPATCDDRKWNGDETGIDCGGPCQSCRNFCNDGILNGNEYNEADCFGSCDPCGVNLIENGDFEEHNCTEVTGRVLVDGVYEDVIKDVSTDVKNCIPGWENSHGRPFVSDFLECTNNANFSGEHIELFSRKHWTSEYVVNEQGNKYTSNEPWSTGVFTTLKRPLDPRRRYILSFDWSLSCPSYGDNHSALDFYTVFATGIERGEKVEKDKDDWVSPDYPITGLNQYGGTITHPYLKSEFDKVRVPHIDNRATVSVIEGHNLDNTRYGRVTRTFDPINDRLDQLWFYTYLKSEGIARIYIDNVSLISIPNPDGFYCARDETYTKRSSIFTATRSVKNTITLKDDVILEPSDDLSFKAGEAINIQPGVTIAQGAKTHFYIAECEDFNFIEDDVIFEPANFDNQRQAYDLYDYEDENYNEEKDDFYLYPNPTSGELTIGSNDSPLSEISVFNSLGNLVYHNGQNIESHQIDLTSLPDGIYIVKAINTLGMNFEQKISFSR